MAMAMATGCCFVAGWTGHAAARREAASVCHSSAVRRALAQSACECSWVQCARCVSAKCLLRLWFLPDGCEGYTTAECERLGRHSKTIPISTSGKAVLGQRSCRQHGGLVWLIFVLLPDSFGLEKGWLDSIALCGPICREFHDASVARATPRRPWRGLDWRRLFVSVPVHT